MRRSIQIIKWWPIVMTLIMMIGLICVLFNASIMTYTGPLFGICFFTSLCWYYFSLDFKFCFWHRLFILNLAINSLIVLYDKIYHIPFVFYMRGLILLCCITILVSSILYFTYGCFKINTKGIVK